MNMKNQLPDLTLLSKRIENVQCWVTYADSRQELVDSTSNLVVYNAQEIIVAAIAAGLTGSADGHVVKWKAGSAVAPKIVESADTALADASPFEKNFIASNVSISGSQLAFSLIMEKAEANAGTDVRNYTELGLFTASNKMLARVLTSAPIPKDDSIRLEWRWTVGY